MGKKWLCKCYKFSYHPKWEDCIEAIGNSPWPILTSNCTEIFWDNGRHLAAFIRLSAA